MRDRLVLLGESRKNELMIMYIEPLGPCGLTDESFGEEEKPPWLAGSPATGGLVRSRGSGQLRKPLIGVVTVWRRVAIPDPGRLRCRENAYDRKWISPVPVATILVYDHSSVCGVRILMIKIDARKGTYSAHDWHLIRGPDTNEGIFYVPTLSMALLLSEDLTTGVLSTGSLTETLEGRINRKLDQPVQAATRRPEAFHLAIGLTHNCTLNCVYCHAEADRDIRIDDRIISASIDHAFERAGSTPKKTLSVSFAVGGEPTMNWGTFTATVDRIRQLESEASQGVDRVFLSMTTNCYYGARRREYIAENFDTLTLSIDGYAEIQDRHRPNRRFGGSYAVVADTCDFFLHDPRVEAGLRGTVSKLSVGHLTDIVDHYRTRFGTGYTVAFEPLIMIGRAVRGDLSPPTNQEFAIELRKARERGVECGIRIVTSAANIDRLVGRYCGAMAIPSFTVCTDGTITACHRDQDGKDYGYGKIDPASLEIVVDDSRVMANVAQTDPRPECDGCFARLHCAGDCPDIRRVGYSRCDTNQFLIYKQLLEQLTSARQATVSAAEYDGHVPYVAEGEC